MQKFILLPIALTIATSHAAVLTPPAVNFTFNQTYGSVLTPQVVFDSSYLTASVPAFETTLGTLESFAITWTLSGNFSGTLATAGAASSSYSGPFLVAGSPASAVASATGGGGNGFGGGPGTVINLALTSGPTSSTQTFAVSGAGTTYDQSILTAILGTNPVALQWNTPLTISGGTSGAGTWSNLTVAGTASAAISYTYSPVPEPSAALLGVSALGVACLRRRRL